MDRRAMLEPAEWELSLWRQERSVQRSYLVALIVLAVVLLVLAVVALFFVHEVLLPLLRAVSNIGPVND